MPAMEMQGPFCQSCSMPLARPEDFGTDASGRRVNDYCGYCYQKGAFTNPAITIEEMTDLCVGVMVKRGMPEPEARAMMTDTLPGLKRWAGCGCQYVPAGGRGCEKCGDEEC